MLVIVIREAFMPEMPPLKVIQFQNRAIILTCGTSKVRHGGEPSPDGLDMGGIILRVFSQLALG